MERRSEWEDVYGANAQPMAQQALLPLDVLVPWQGADGAPQPFRPYTPEELKTLAENIRQNGVIEAITVRPKGDGQYEIIAGHNRCAAARLAGLAAVPAQIVVISDEEAAIRLVDSNLRHRQTLLPSEKASAYKLRLEAQKNQHLRGSAEDYRSDEAAARELGISPRTLQLYIRLTELLPPLLKRVDDGRIKVNAAVELSYLAPKDQQTLLKVLGEDGKVSIRQADTLRWGKSEYGWTWESGWTEDGIRRVLSPTEKKKEPPRMPMSQRIADLFPADTSPKDMEEMMYQALLRYQGKP